MRHLTVSFEWQQGPSLQLSAVRELPADKAKAFLTKLQQSERDAQKMVANYQPEPLDWQVHDTSFMGNLQFKETENMDLKVESFKVAMNGIATSYCPHYNSSHFRALFASKVQTLEQIKQDLAKQARSVNDIQEESKGLQA